MTAYALVIAVALAGAPNAPAPTKKSDKTQLKVEVKPAGAKYVLDGKSSGSGSKVRTFTVDPGTHYIKVSFKGDEHQEPVTVKRGEVKTYIWEFQDDKPKKAGHSNEGTEGEAPEAEGGADTISG